MGVLANHLLVVSGSATTTYLCWLCHSPLLDKEGYFVCLLAMGFSTRFSVCALSLSLMACTWWFQLILTFFGWHVIPAGHFPQKSMCKNPRIGFFFLSPPPDHALWPITHHFLYWLGIGWWCLGLARASPSSPAAHAFAMFWSLVCTFCRALLASYGMGCFLICHSLWLAPFGDWALLDHGPSFARLILCSLRGLVSIFLSYHSTILVVMLLDSILLGLFGPTVYFPPSDSMYSQGLFLHCLRATVSHFLLGHLWPICFPWTSSAIFQSYFPKGLY